MTPIVRALVLNIDSHGNVIPAIVEQHVTQSETVAQQMAEVHPVLEEMPTLHALTMPETHANALEWIEIRTATTQDLRKAISDLEKFTGEPGELSHFIKGGDRLMGRIQAKNEERLLDGGDAEELKAAVVCRVKRGILNQIQADEETPWNTVKERLMKAYGGGRWAPEEDIFQMFRERRKQGQSKGRYAGELLARYNRITDKLSELMVMDQVQARMFFLSGGPVPAHQMFRVWQRGAYCQTMPLHVQKKGSRSGGTHGS
nr:uncharacterized protein LOC112210541 [Halyomorpha halys]